MKTAVPSPAYRAERLRMATLLVAELRARVEAGDSTAVPMLPQAEDALAQLQMSDQIIAAWERGALPELPQNERVH